MRSRSLRNEGLIFERNAALHPRQGLLLPNSPGVDEVQVREDESLLLGDSVELWPDLGEMDVVTHFHRLSQQNYAVDEGLYPLGSCTMKYNPRINEVVSRFPGLTEVHPAQPDRQVQGALRLLWELEEALKRITGMAGVTLQPAAGAHGELTGMLMIRKAIEARGEQRSKVLVPDSAHGTNPASAVFAGFKPHEISSGPDGRVDLELLREKMDKSVAALMLTVPNTLGVFESEIVEIAQLVHEHGAFLYLDGANLNAFVGKASPALMGADAMHINLHKTFSTPHGGGGPGAGPVVVSEALLPHLPVPRVVREGSSFRMIEADGDSIGSMRGFVGSFLILVRALAYIRGMGSDGLKEMSETAVLYANIIRERLKGAYHLAYETPSLHEVVFDDTIQAEKDVHNVDIAKRLLDFGFHPPTMSFPMIVHGALMIEPTESVGPEEIDAFCDAMLAIAAEAKNDPEWLASAPHQTPVRRVDEVRAVRQLKVRYTGKDAGE